MVGPDEVMRRALKQTGRAGEFVRSCLFRLWPDSKGLLREVARRVGEEIRLPEDRHPLLVRSIRAGYEQYKRFHRQRRRWGLYLLTEWDQNVFLGFFYGLFWQAAAVGYCRIWAQDGSAWTVMGPPYLEWRQRHPGPVMVEWHDDGDQGRTACRLAWQAMLAQRKNRLWIERRLLEVLSNHGKGQ